MNTVVSLVALDGRLDRVETRLTAIGDRVDRLEAKVDQGLARVDERFTKIDERLAAIDGRFEKIDERFAKVDERFNQIDERFVELRRHFDVVAESWNDKFGLLYDFVQAQAEKTDKRFEELTALIQSNTADLRMTIKMTYASLDRRITALAAGAPGPNKRRQ